MDENLGLAHSFVKKHPLEAARLLEKGALSELQEFFQSGPPETFAHSLKFMPPMLACSILEKLSPDIGARLLSNLPLENSLLILKQIKHETSQGISGKLPEHFLNHLNKKMAFPDKTAGFIMNPQILTIPMDYTVEQASAMVKKYPDYISYYIYVVDRQQKFKGYLVTRQLIVADTKEKIEHLAMPFPESLNPYTPFREIVKFSGWQDKHAIPVVDKEGILLGAISYQNLKQIEKLLDQDGEEQSNEDLEKWTEEVISVGLVGMVKAACSSLVSFKK